MVKWLSRLTVNQLFLVRIQVGEQPDEKDFTIGGKSWSFEKLKKESDKCILVCSNCHKEIHYEQKTPQ